MDDLEVLTVRTPDGRALECRVGGPADGDVLLVHDGTPGSGILPTAFVETAAARNLRTVGFARPGYASSTRRPGRTVSDVAGDAVAILDHLGADRCFTMGASGGGPHALACAALIPDRIRATTTVAGVAPFGADGLDFLAGMAPENVEEFGAALEGPDALERFLTAAAPGFANATATEIADALGELVPPVDYAALSGDFAEAVSADIRNALSSGIWGWFDDDLAFARPWGFDPAAITGQVDVWQGGQDRMVPFAHGIWLADHVGNARSHLLAEHGHLSLLVDLAGPILDEMLAGAVQRG